jgi:hypothetical protein
MVDFRYGLKLLLWAPIIIAILLVWFVAASIEQGYYYLKGYSWDSIRGGYWHRETGKSARALR